MENNSNFFTFAGYLANPGNISSDNWTLPELNDFAAFMATLGAGYGIEPMHDLFLAYARKARDYEITTDSLSLEELNELSSCPKAEDWLGERFIELKNMAEDMAFELTHDGPWTVRPFFQRRG